MNLKWALVINKIFNYSGGVPRQGELGAPLSPGYDEGLVQPIANWAKHREPVRRDL